MRSSRRRGGHPLPSGAAMQLVPDEKQRAAAGYKYANEQYRVAPSKETLAASTLINAALGHLPTDHKHAKLFKDLAAELSINTLKPWAKGAALMIGDKKKCATVLGVDFAKAMFEAGENGKAGPFLDELRKRHGDDWGAALNAAQFITEKQRGGLYDGVWDKIPAGVMGYDSDHRGYPHMRANTGFWVNTLGADARAELR